MFNMNPDQVKTEASSDLTAAPFQPPRPNRASRAVSMVIFGGIVVVALFGAVSNGNQDNQSSVKNPGSRMYYLRLPPPCNENENAGKVLRFEDGERMCLKRDPLNCTSRKERGWVWSPMSITECVQHSNRPGTPWPSGFSQQPSCCPEEDQSSDDSSWTSDEETPWEVYYNGREYVNDPYDTWGDGR